jgi:hypothetical protein
MQDKHLILFYRTLNPLVARRLSEYQNISKILDNFEKKISRRARYSDMPVFFACNMQRTHNGSVGGSPTR